MPYQQWVLSFRSPLSVRLATTLTLSASCVARYLLRPASALEAITATDDGRVRLDIPRRGRFVTMTPHQLLAKLAALVPAPGTHLVRYHGVFASQYVTLLHRWKS